MKSSSANADGVIEKVKGAGGMIVGVTENRTWIKLFYGRNICRRPFCMRF